MKGIRTATTTLAQAAAAISAVATLACCLPWVERWPDPGWMILQRGSLTLEFFLHPELDPPTSWFSCCPRLDDLDAFYAICRDAGIPEACKGQPRLHPPKVESWGGRLAAIVDPDGTLVRLIQN
jgi:hypothetical protein